ncbi:MAG: DUF6094 domain-containing protein [Chloroflexota bacterium]
MGYLPILETHHAAIVSLVAAGTPAHKFLDPTAGCGEFAEVAGRAWNLTVYTNELDHDRADARIERFGANALQGDMERLTASNNAFSLLWNNPPYDIDKTAEGESKRVEYLYLRHSWKWAQNGGIVMWCVYLHHLTEAAAAFLAKNSSRVDVWALPGKHLDCYDQIIVVAIKGQHPNPEALYESILEAKAKPRLLTVQAEPIYKLPAPPHISRFVFAPDVVDSATGKRYLDDQGAWRSAKFQSYLQSAAPTTPTLVSVIPPRPGHTTIVLAAGMADGAVIESEAYGTIALRGKTRVVEKTVRVDVEQNQDPDHPTIKTTKRLSPTSTIALLSKSGTVVQLNDDEAMIKFITDHKAPLNRYIESRFNPLYRFDLNGMRPYLDAIKLNGKHPLYMAQKHVIAAVCKGFEQRDGILLVGQMGTGKTALGSSSAVAIGTGAAKAMRDTLQADEVVLIVCPPHLVSKWEREAQSISPRTFIARIKRHEDLKAFMDKASKLGPGIAKIAILKREMTKLGSGHTTAVHWKPHNTPRWGLHEPTPPNMQDLPRLQRDLVPTCAACGKIVLDGPDDNRKVIRKYALEKSKHVCEYCHEPLWTEVRDSSSRPLPGHKYPRGNPRYRLDQYLKQCYPDRIALLIWDEVHEAQNSDSGNGEAFGRLSGLAKKTLAMTGTPFNGKASSLFNLEYHLNAKTRAEYNWGGAQRLSRKQRDLGGAQDLLDHDSKQRGNAEARWVSLMGVREGGEDQVPQYDRETGSYTGTNTYTRPYTEAPGISPLLVAWMLDHTIFFSLKDMTDALPDYQEIAWPVALDSDLQSEHDRTKQSLKDYLIARRWEGDTSFKGAYFHWCVDWINSAFLPYEIIHNQRHPITRELMPHTVKNMPGMGTERIYSKEQELLRIVEEELAADRPCIVYCRQTDKRNIQLRLKTLIEAHTPLAKAFILEAKVDPERREALIEKTVRQGFNVIISNPELVKTGLDLVFAGTLIFFEPIYNLGTMMQASGRNYRLNQKRHQLCKVIYLYYEDTMEETAIQLMSRKQRAAKILQGDTGLTGLEALSEGSGGLEEALLSHIESQSDLINPADLFKNRDELAIIDAEDTHFWNVALTDDPTAVQEPEPLVACAARLGATITALPAASPAPIIEAGDLFTHAAATRHRVQPAAPGLQATRIRDAIRQNLSTCWPPEATDAQKQQHEGHVAALTELFNRFIAETPIFWEDGNDAVLSRDLRLYLLRNHVGSNGDAFAVASKIMAALKPAALEAAKARLNNAQHRETRKKRGTVAERLNAALPDRVERFQQSRESQQTPAAAESFTQISLFG